MSIASTRAPDNASWIALPPTPQKASTHTPQNGGRSRRRATWIAINSGVTEYHDSASKRTPSS